MYPEFMHQGIPLNRACNVNDYVSEKYTEVYCTASIHYHDIRPLMTDVILQSIKYKPHVRTKSIKLCRSVTPSPPALCQLKLNPKIGIDSPIFLVPPQPINDDRDTRLRSIDTVDEVDCSLGTMAQANQIPNHIPDNLPSGELVLDPPSLSFGKKPRGFSPSNPM
jgi:hypothetical protein